MKQLQSSCISITNALLKFPFLLYVHDRFLPLVFIQVNFRAFLQAHQVGITRERVKEDPWGENPQSNMSGK